MYANSTTSLSNKRSINILFQLKKIKHVKYPIFYPAVICTARSISHFSMKRYVAHLDTSFIQRISSGPVKRSSIEIDLIAYCLLLVAHLSVRSLSA